MIEAAYLRIYIPSDRMGTYPRYAGGGSHRIIAASEHFVWGESDREDAFRADFEGRSYVCPRSPRLRMLEGVVAFSNAFPTSGLLPERVVLRAAAELDELRADLPDSRSHILTSPWHVPLRWFLPFAPDQREIYDYEGHSSIRYRALLGPGRARVKQAAETLDDAGFDAAVVEQVTDLGRWLDEFSSDAMVELDYAGVASLFSDADLAFDDSAEAVNASIQALADLDYELAGRHYATVAGRWAQAQAVSYVN